MRNTILLFLAIMGAANMMYAAPKSKNNCKIKVNITSPKDGLIFIKNLSKSTYDTVEVKNNSFNYDCKIDEIMPFIISNPQNNYQIFFAEPNGNIEIQYDQTNSKIITTKGSSGQLIFEDLMKLQGPLQQKASGIQKNYNNAINKDSLNKEMVDINVQLQSNFYKFLKENGNSQVTAFIIYSSLANSPSASIQIGDSMYENLTESARQSHFGKETKLFISKLKSVTVGYEAPDFTLPDSSGKKTYKLSSFRGKYIFVDFWASWCGPCKQEIPFVKKAYEKFHGKDFDVVSVSLDDSKEKWMAALKQFEMPWTQISDSKGFKSIVNELYHIPSIPKTLLLDKEGKIIATDLRGDDLENKLKELLPQ